MTYLWLGLLSAGLVRLMIRFGTLDHPGARSSHAQPTPKGGGVGIVVAFMAGFLLLPSHHGLAAFGVLSAAVLIAVISYLDDLYTWSFKIKFCAQLLAALVAIGCGIRLQVVHLPWFGAVDTGWLGVPLTAAWIVFATNALNFIDGLNGLASGSTCIACLFLAGFAATQGDAFAQTACLALAAGIAGFLPFNFPKARIFMGDVGSQFCGFVSAVLGVLASRFGPQTLSALLVPMLLFGVYFDVVFTLVRRALAGDRLTEAHRSHLYQVAHRSHVPAACITLIHWGMVAWGGVICAAFEASSGAAKTILPVCVILPQLAWLWFVMRRAGRAGVHEW